MDKSIFDQPGIAWADPYRLACVAMTPRVLIP
eukprot:SAG11_NODE_18655_length_484_cov_2.075325_1_plen_31_part_10